MYRDSSIAPLIDLKHDSGGFTLARSLKLSAQWNCILMAGPVHLISAEDLLR